MSWNRKPATTSAEVSRGEAVGVVMSNAERFNFIRRTMDEAWKIDLQGSTAGLYTIHALGAGVELGAAYRPKPERGEDHLVLCCSSPFFRGHSRNHVTITERFPKDDCQYCGSYAARLEAGDPEFGLDKVEFSFASPYFARYADRNLPFDAIITLSAVVKSLTVYENEGHWFECQKELREKGIQISAQYFGVGEFENRSDRYAFSAIVKDSKVRNSAISGLPFVWALVESFRVVADLLIAPELHDRELCPGNIVFANAEMVGDLVDDCPE